MADMGKVIKGLEICSEHGSWHGLDCEHNEAYKDCPYRGCETGCVVTIAKDAIALLKEQKAVEWINVKDRLPEKDGQYLVVYTFFNYKSMGIMRFSHNLREVDEYIFDEENRPGWYESDDEVGYFERTTVTHWAKLPKFPKEGR